MRRGDEAEAWLQALRPFDESFERAAAALGESLGCRRGCSSCCESAGFFEIHGPDAALLRHGMAEAPPAVRARIAARAALVVETVRSAARSLGEAREPRLAGWQPEEGLGSLGERQVEAMADSVRMACPVLDPDGTCALHAWRPAICRLQGLAWRDPQTGSELPDFCDLESRASPMPIAEGPLHLLDEVRESIRGRLEQEGRAGSSTRTFVAAALLAP